MRRGSIAARTLALSGPLLALSLACASSGCASSARKSAPASEAPAPQASPAPQSVQTLGNESELTRAERELDDADARLASEATEAGAGISDDAEYESGAPSPGSASRCSAVCKAYASLLRARAAICRIDGKEGPRCERANFTVERHEHSRAACDCPKE